MEKKSIYTIYSSSSEKNVDKANEQTREEMVNVGRWLTVLWLSSVNKINLAIINIG